MRDNVVKAIQHFTPYAGRCIKWSGDRRTKDHEKIRRFIERGVKAWHIKEPNKEMDFTENSADVSSQKH